MWGEKLLVSMTGLPAGEMDVDGLILYESLEEKCVLPTQYTHNGRIHVLLTLSDNSRW
jgi:hypothetical protein